MNDDKKRLKLVNGKVIEIWSEETLQNVLEKMSYKITKGVNSNEIRRISVFTKERLKFVRLRKLKNNVFEKGEQNG